jgi:hypothetical protein
MNAARFSEVTMIEMTGTRCASVLLKEIIGPKGEPA